MSTDRWGVPTRQLASVVLGTLLNPLNSSMIAVALVPLQHEFGVGVATSTWLVSGFYLAAAVGQPLMGRLVDLFGARRLFVSGLVVVCVACLLAPFAPGFWWLLGVRVLLAAGTSTAFPAALVLIRAAAIERQDAGTTERHHPTTKPNPTTEPRPPAAALAFLTVAASTSAALGPVLGGFLIAVAGWEAIFLVNVPLTVIGILLALRVLPKIPASSTDDTSFLASVDLPGIVLFSGTLLGLLVFVLSVEGGTTMWWLTGLVVVLAILLVLRERSTPRPFIDIRGLIANRALTAVLGQQGGFNLVFYCVFFGLPMWLGSIRGFDADTVGLLVLPIAAMGVLMTPLAARVVEARGSRATLVFGSLVLLLATLLVQVLSDATPIVVIVAVALLFGIPGGFNNLGLQTALYEASPGHRMGSSGGLFQTFRYLGAISATSVLGVVFGHDLSSAGLHRIGWIMTGVAAALVLLALVLRPRPASTPASPPTAPIP
ncbi:MAG: MFS transporter [Actinopolymorphaceae bacterium]